MILFLAGFVGGAAVVYFTSRSITSKLQRYENKKENELLRKEKGSMLSWFIIPVPMILPRLFIR